MNVNAWDVSTPIAAIVPSGRAVDLDRLDGTDVSLEEI